jgi:hypothetical protein
LRQNDVAVLGGGPAVHAAGPPPFLFDSMMRDNIRKGLYSFEPRVIRKPSSPADGSLE